MKQHINEVKSPFNPAFGSKAYIRWEFLKYEIRILSKKCSKNKVKLWREKLSRLEVKLKELEQNLSNDEQKNSIMLTEAKLIKSMTK